MKASLLLLLLAAAAVTLAGSARAAGPVHDPSRLFYRVALVIDDFETNHNGETLTVKSLWRIESAIPVMVTARCRTRHRVVEGTCRTVFHGNVPSRAVEDITFQARGTAVLDRYRWTWTARPVSLGEGTRCPGRTTSLTSHGATFTGRMSGSLGESGVRFAIGPPRGGTMTVNEPGGTCTSPTLGTWTQRRSVSGRFPLKDYPAAKPGLSQLAVRAAAKLRVRPGMFGHGFDVTAEESETAGTRTATSKVRLVFTLD